MTTSLRLILYSLLFSGPKEPIIQINGDGYAAEHIEISNITAVGTLTPITYTDAQNGGEHIEITGITAVGTLTHINDI